MNRSVLIAIGISLAAFAWIASGMIGGHPDASAAGQGTEKPLASLPKVRVLTSHSQVRQTSLVLHGQTQAKQIVSLRAETGGQVASLAVTKGQTVAVGQELLRLTLKDRPAKVAEAKARVAQMRLEYDQASKLASKEFASRSTVAQARANLENAQAALALVQQDVADTIIRAPFAGVFDENTVEVGDYVSPGGVIGTLVNLDPLTIIAEVAEKAREHIVADGTAQVTPFSGQSREGKISWVSRVANPVTRTYKVEIVVPNQDLSIPSGMTVQVAVPLSSQPAHLISPSILTLDDRGKIGVKALNAQDQVIFYPVVPDTDSSAGMWVLGLPETVRFIAVGGDYVPVGAQVIAVALSENGGAK